MSTSSTSIDKDKQNIESDKDYKSIDPEQHLLPLTEEELFKLDALKNLKSSEDKVISRSPTPGQPQYDLYAVDGSLKSDLVSVTDSVEASLSNPDIQSENPTDTIMKEAVSDRPHVSPTSTRISISNTESGTLVSNSLQSSEGGGEMREVRKKSPSSLITSSLSVDTSSSEDCRAKRKQEQEEKAELCAPQKDLVSNLTLISSRIQKGEEQNSNDLDALPDKILANEIRENLEIEKPLKGVSSKVNATRLFHAGEKGGGDHSDVREEESLKHPTVEVTNNQTSEFIYRRLHANPTPGIKGQRVRF